MRAGWFLDSVQIKVPNQGKQYMFPSHRWLSEDEADGKTEVEIYPSEILEIEKCTYCTLCIYLFGINSIRISTLSVFFQTVINYEVTVITGDVWAGGTNANVFIQIYGEEGKTELITLKSRSNNFERGTTNIFKVMTKIYGVFHGLRHTLLLPIAWFVRKYFIPFRFYSL